MTPGPNHGSLCLLACAIVDCGRNGGQLAAGGTFTLSDCGVQGNAWNGIVVDKAAIAVVAQCAITCNGTLADEKRGYGILRLTRSVVEADPARGDRSSRRRAGGPASCRGA